MLALLLLSCTSEPEAPPAPPPEPPEAPAPEPAPPDDDAPPPGRIGGDPILPNPIVLGGISRKAVDEGIATVRDGIQQCYTDQLTAHPGLNGKVLVRITIGQDGSVWRSVTKSTSLRNDTAEACINEQLARATFPRLESGGTAIVTYPFSFPR